MSERKSSRSRKQLDYSKFQQSDNDSGDDDFVSSSPVIDMSSNLSISKKKSKKSAKKDKESTTKVKHKTDLENKSPVRKKPALMTEEVKQTPIPVSPNPSPLVLTPPNPTDLVASILQNRDSAGVAKSLVAPNLTPKETHRPGINHQKMKTWTPPAQGSNSVASASMTSAISSPGLRIGLSRKQNIKPLHSNIRLSR